MEKGVGELETPVADWFDVSDERLERLSKVGLIATRPAVKGRSRPSYSLLPFATNYLSDFEQKVGLGSDESRAHQQVFGYPHKWGWN